MMTADDRHVTGGVDTHGEVHVAAVLDSATGRRIDVGEFRADTTGYVALREWMMSFGEVDAVGVESTGAWGAGLTRSLREAAVTVIEVDRPDRRTRRLEGKSDPIDAEAAARAVISGRASGVPKSADGPAEAIRTLEIVCYGATRDRTRAINQFRALVVTAPAELRERLEAEPFRRQLDLARRFRHDYEDLVETQLRFALKTLAAKIGFLSDQIVELETRMNALVGAAAPALAGTFGVGPHVAAQLLSTVGDNPERLGSEAAFAKLCAACPIPASSGKTTRHRLNRGGDRRANNALYTIVLVRMRHDPRTRAYVARRTAEGKSRAEIMRCLKRFVAREIYRIITNPPKDIPTGPDIRKRRLSADVTLTALANTLGVAPTRLSTLERGLTFSNELAYQAHTWLTENTP